MIFSDVVYDILDEDEMSLLSYTLNQGLSANFRDPRYCQVLPTMVSMQSLSGLNEDGVSARDKILEKIKIQYL